MQDNGHKGNTTGKDAQMNDHIDTIIAIVAAIFVLTTAILDPRVSSGIAVALLIVFAVYRLSGKPINHT
jgi:hypothetical protein